ncbi:hypothetical protein IT774_05210 [Salinimonas marina]|uniref:Uncharacterized protein n=1 Tax=Salinimonas marina TaxID=2785918 RepID=A0A7S9DZL4_9ALTE|nr:hypothetical protein [Salinimonas marina]QPG06573.1 hypothetical protein IT774_05210 [Salinimonas marina]
MLFRNDHNLIEVPVMDSRGTPTDAAIFSQAAYTIFEAGTMKPLYEATLLNGITVEDGEFRIRTPAIDYVGQTFHEMRVADVAGNQSTILQTTTIMKTTRVSL